MWDEEVDVVCVGGALGALASAIVAADDGADVYVATAPHPDAADPVVLPPPSHLHRGWLTHAPEDEELREYFEALSEDLTKLDATAGDADVPTRSVRELTQDERENRWVEPFFGGRIRSWSTECLRSPYGLLHSRVSDWPTTTMRTLDGRGVEVATLGTVDASEAATTVVDWLADRAHERHVPVYADAALQRLVFEDGQVVGAILHSADGPYAVRARHGVTIAPADTHAIAAGNRPLPVLEGFSQLGLVSEKASRFARLELLNVTSPVPNRAVVCHPVHRRLHHAPHEGRPRRSDAGRRREAQRYPAGGQ